MRSKLQESMDRAAAGHLARGLPHKPAVTLSSVPGAHRTRLIAKCDQDGIFTVQPAHLIIGSVKQEIF